MIKESCNGQELLTTVVDIFCKSLFTDGMSTLVFSNRSINKLSVSVVAGTISYTIRAIWRKCIELEEDYSIAGVSLNPYAGGLIGGAVKYILKNPNSPDNILSEGMLGAFNGFGCEAMFDAGMNGSINRTTSLAALKVAEVIFREDYSLNGILKGAGTGIVSGIGFNVGYLPIKDIHPVYTNQVIDFTQTYLLGLNSTQDEPL